MYKVREFETKQLLHGGDYNPEQWLSMPEILDKDIELLTGAGINVVSLGIFAWAELEPEEGVFNLDWMEKIINRLWKNGIRTILATPSGARPKWLADKYPEVLRVSPDRRRMLFGARHNHCLTSPVYREKVARIDRELAKRFGSHPGVILWHISNEFSGECHCPLCQDAFRSWLKDRYTTIDNLNAAWYTKFWSHSYQSFEQVESPSPLGEIALHGLNLDWKRFVSEQTASFIAAEREVVREYSDLPVTVNLMYYFTQLNYARLAREIDIVSWDTYPAWNKWPLVETAEDNGFWHDVMRSLLKKPYIQMESCPSATNWQGVSKLKKPGLLMAQGLQAIAHGADADLYFQIRQSRGSSEKFHGAVIDHYGGADTRVLSEVSEVSEALKKLTPVVGSRTKAGAAILFDWENIWAMEDAQGPRNDDLHWKDLTLKIYHGLCRLGLNVDVIGEDADLSDYSLVAVPMAYQFREGFAEKLASFTAQGGILLTTFWSGVADGTDLCYLGPRPHGLVDVLGLRSEEIDGLYDWEENELVRAQGEDTLNIESLRGPYTCKYLCELPRLSTAKAVLSYGRDFYAGKAAVTRNTYGEGSAWYVAAHAGQEFFDDLMEYLAAEAGLQGPMGGSLPAGIQVTERTDAEHRYIFIQNFSETAWTVEMPAGEWKPLYGNPDEPLPVYGTLVLESI
ncbi:MAG: beta-galactosidase [Blautia sp.]|nr:beta-galactosidase [Blautia sp.]